MTPIQRAKEAIEARIYEYNLSMVDEQAFGGSGMSGRAMGIRDGLYLALVIVKNIEAESVSDPRPEPPSIAAIVAEWLRCHGYDGLCIPGECGCCVDDLMPCGCCNEGECMAGYKGPPTPEGGDWAIYLSREAVAEAESRKATEEAESVPGREPNDRTKQDQANDSRSGTQGDTP